MTRLRLPPGLLPAAVAFVAFPWVLVVAFYGGVLLVGHHGAACGVTAVVTVVGIMAAEIGLLALATAPLRTATPRARIRPVLVAGAFAGLASALMVRDLREPGLVVISGVVPGLVLVMGLLSRVLSRRAALLIVAGVVGVVMAGPIAIDCVGRGYQ